MFYNYILFYFFNISGPRCEKIWNKNSIFSLKKCKKIIFPIFFTPKFFFPFVYQGARKDETKTQFSVRKINSKKKRFQHFSTLNFILFSGSRCKKRWNKNSILGWKKLILKIILKWIIFKHYSPLIYFLTICFPRCKKRRSRPPPKPTWRANRRRPSSRNRPANRAALSRDSNR